MIHANHLSISAFAFLKRLSGATVVFSFIKYLKDSLYTEVAWQLFSHRHYYQNAFPLLSKFKSQASHIIWEGKKVAEGRSYLISSEYEVKTSRSEFENFVTKFHQLRQADFTTHLDVDGIW